MEVGEGGAPGRGSGGGCAWCGVWYGNFDIIPGSSLTRLSALCHALTPASGPRRHLSFRLLRGCRRGVQQDSAFGRERRGRPRRSAALGRGCPHALWDIPEHALLSARTNQVLIGAWIQLLSQIWGRLQVGDAVLSLLSHTSRFGTICPLDAGVVTGPDVVLAWACFGPLSVLIGLSYLVRAVYVNKFPAWTPHYAASVITFFFCFFFAVRPTYMRGSEGGVPSRPLSSVLLSGEGAIAGRDCL